MEVIEDIDEVEGLVRSEEAAINMAVADASKAGVQAVVTNTYDIFFVRAQSPSSAVELSKLTRIVRTLGPGKESQISQGVYDSWIARTLQDATTTRSEKRTTEANQAVNDLLDSAIAAKASDVHINVREETTIQYRIHGMLVQRQRVTAKIGHALVASLFQHYAGTSYGVKEEARDGKFYYTSRGKSFMVRLNKMVMVDHGVTCKMRLRQTDEKVDLAQSGYSEHQLNLFRHMMSAGMGLLVLTGAVNSGKSTTMTALLKQIPNHFAILEISDTVEVRLDNVCHIELPSDGENLEKRIASIRDAVVRQDSDYLAIGEIRNRTTAAQAEVLGLQGKFVLSTGHSADCISFYQRMVSKEDFGMSVETVLGPDFVRGIVSQTLIETICSGCSSKVPTEDVASRTSFETPEAVRRHFLFGLGEKARGIRFHNPEGCTKCGRTGLSGRTVVAEVLPFDNELREILRAGDYYQVEAWMKERSIETKHEHALPKVLAGRIDPLHLGRRIDSLGPNTIPSWGKHAPAKPSAQSTAQSSAQPATQTSTQPSAKTTTQPTSAQLSAKSAAKLGTRPGSAQLKPAPRVKQA